MGTPLKVPNRPQQLPEDRLVQLLTELRQTMGKLADQIIDKSQIVDEYISQPLYGVPMSVASLEVQPQFQRIPEAIDHIIVTGPSSPQPLEFQTGAPVVAPAANANVLSVSAASLPPAGNYTLNWTLSLTGTPGAGEVNNVKIVFGSTLATSVNPGVVGDFPQAPVSVFIPVGNANALTAKAIAAGTAGAGYAVSFYLTPAGGNPFALQLGDRYWPGLALPADGCFEVSPKAMLLYPNDRRILTPAFPGQWSLELIGHTDVRNPL